MKPGTPFNPSPILKKDPLRFSFIKYDDLGSSQRLVYLYLLAYSRGFGYCSQTQKYIADQLGFSLSQIKKIIRALKVHHYIRTVRFNRRYPAIYYFLWRKIFSNYFISTPPLPIDPQLHRSILNASKKRERPK